MKKDYSLDLIRVISMFLVIVIHVSNIYSRNYINISDFSYFFATFFNGLARVSVPLFFMISGALLLSKKDDDSYKKRITKMLIILISWSVIYYLWDIFVMNYDKPLVATFFRSFFIPLKAHLWFLYSLIGIYIVLPFIRKIFNNTSYKEDKLFIYLWMFFTGFVYIFRLMIQLLNIKTTITYPVPLVQGTYYLGYFVLGYIIYKNIDKIKISNKIKNITLISTISFIILGTYIVSLISNSYYEGLFAYRSILYMLFASIIMLYTLENKKMINSKMIKIISFISPYSFGIYLSHVIFLNILNMYKITVIPSLIGIPIYSILLFILSFIFVYLLKKIKYIKEII
jgi:surface polysaccharide O-acyltransferase-like enzyme